MVPSQARADRPAAQANEVLRESRLLKIGTAARAKVGWPWKIEYDRRSRIETRRIGNRAGEVFVQKHIVRFDSDLPFVHAAMNGYIAFEVFFAEPVALKRNDGCRKRIGIQIIRILAHHAPQVPHNIG